MHQHYFFFFLVENKWAWDVHAGRTKDSIAQDIVLDISISIKYNINIKPSLHQRIEVKTTNSKQMVWDQGSDNPVIL